MNTDLRKKAKDNFEKDFFKLMNYAVFGKTMQNVGKHRDIKLVTTERRRNYLVSEPSFHTTNFFIENLLAIGMKKTETLMNKPVCLWLSVLEVSEILMYQFWYDYVKPKYDEKAKMCYMDTDNFIVYIKTDDIYKDIVEGVETRFDISNYELACSFIVRPLPKGKNEKVIGLMKGELGGKIMTKFVGLRAKTCNYLTDGDREDEKAKGTESCAIKKPLNLKIIKTVQKQLNLRINKLSRKNKTDIDSNKENNKEIIKNSKSILQNTAKV